MKRLISAILIAAGMVASTVTHAQQTTLRIVYAFPGRDSLFMQPIAERFMQQNPDVRIKLQANAADCPALLQQLLRAAVTGDLPDVVASVCYPDVHVLAARGLLEPLDGLIASDTDWKNLGVPKSTLETTQWKGKTFALPQSISTSMVYYNMNVIKKIRSPIENLSLTWDQILSMAKDIQAKDKGVTPIFFEYYPDSYNWSFNGLVYSFGGDVFSPDGKVAFNSKAGLAALNLMQRFGQAGMVDLSSEQARQAFAAGKIAIYVASTSRLKQLTADAGTALDIRTGPFPLSAPNGRLQSGGGAMAIMTRDAARREAAWRFLKFAVGPEAQTTMVQKTGLIPVNIAAADDPRYLKDYYSEHPNARTAVAEVPAVKSPNIYPGENGPRITTVIRDDLQSVVTLKRTPAQVLPDMVRDVTQLLPGS